MLGYLRSDGQVGIRNTVQIVFLVECAHHVSKKVAESFGENVQYFGFPGCYPSDYGYRLVRSLCTHSNVGAVLLVSLGCECFDRNRLESDIRASGRPCQTLVIQQEGGTSATIEKGRRIVEGLRTDRAHRTSRHRFQRSDHRNGMRRFGRYERYYR